MVRIDREIKNLVKVCGYAHSAMEDENETRTKSRYPVLETKHWFYWSLKRFILLSGSR